MADDAVKKLKEQGQYYYDKGKFEEAVKTWNEYLNIYPVDAVVWISRGLALGDELDRCEEAIESFDQALSIVDEGSELANAAWKFRADQLYYLGRFQEAVENYEKSEERGWMLRDEKLKALSKMDEWLLQRWPNHAFATLYNLIFPTETDLRRFVRQRLQSHFGNQKVDWMKGVPSKIWADCAKRYNNNHDKKEDELDSAYLMNLWDIMQNNWQLFEADFERVTHRYNGQKKPENEFKRDLAKLNAIRNLVAHPTVEGAATADDHLDFARQMYQVLKDFTG